MKLLKESPDHYYLTAENNNGKFIDGNWRDSDAWCFCYYQDKFYIEKSCSHYRLLKTNIVNCEDINGIIDEAYYKGRFWKNGKYLAFWDNPSKNILPKIINDIYKDTRIKITDDWWIELDQDKDPIKIGNYLGHKRKEIDMSKRHLTSPLYKNKKDVNGFGSEKYEKISSSNGFNSVAQMNYLKNENKLTLKCILNEINKSQKQILLQKAINKFGEKAVMNALEDLSKWTKGDVFRINSKRMEILKAFIGNESIPKKLYKGIRFEIFDYSKLKHSWDGFNSKDKIIKNYFQKKLNKKIFNRYTSWTENPNVAAKFSTGNVILVLKPKMNDVICNVNNVLDDFKFSGTIGDDNPFFLGGNEKAFVPKNEQEWILNLKQDSISRIIFWPVYFKSGKYLGDYSVDTMGLTSRAVSWHVSPF